MDYDVIVVGCGPAGATFARLAPKNMKIAVIDRSLLPSSRPKPCGGLLSPDAQKFFARFDITLPKEILVTPQIFAVKTVDFTSGVTKYYQRSYLNMDREKFDKWLKSLIPGNVDIIPGRCMDISGKAGSFTVTSRENGSERVLTCRYIIGADGAGSLVRRKFFPNVPIRRYNAIQNWYLAPKAEPFYSCVFDKKTSDCCSWSISKDGYLIYGGAFEQKGCRESFEEQTMRACERGFELSESVKTEACTVYRPRRLREIIPGGSGVMLIGEAGGFISPSSLEGISWAMRCGELAALAMKAKDPVGEYIRLSRKLRFKLWLKILKCPFMYDPTLRQLVMRSGLNSLRRDG